MIKVTFASYSKVLNKHFENVETHKCIEDANLRAMALNWTIKAVQEVI